MTSLKDTVAFVTGASSGIGAACAEAFARAGSHLILAARRRERLADLAERLAAEHGVRCHTLGLDVRDRDAVNAAVAALPPAWQAIDVLVNNAGLSRGLDKVQTGDDADWNEMIDTNIKGLLWMSRAVLPGMIARDRGHVINIGSIAGRQVYPGGNVYCATKYAVRALSQGLRLDLLGTRVRCSTVDPGMVETEFSEVRFHGDNERAAQVYRQFPPLSAADVADAVLYCATRPPHVAIAELVIMPQDQAAAYASFPRGVD
ncbi:MAG: SDR family NAD(P)-dependent oxidoreductase [Krumholzibacteria bacterium]|nr:SDR family NAD(P)-dependent oxidoreductase [Candidatus Krumholzibacteria bacterium]